MTTVSSLPTIRIIDEKIYLNDLEIGRYINLIEFTWSADSRHPHILLTIPARIEIPEELQAFIMMQQAESEEEKT